MGYNHSTLEKEKCKEIIKNSKLLRYSCPFMLMSLNFRPQPYLFVMTVVMLSCFGKQDPIAGPSELATMSLFTVK